MDNDLVKLLMQLKDDVSAVRADSAATRQAVEALAGPQGRVTALESAASFNKWYNLCIVPALGLGHALLRYLGVKI